jgi:hypothetical protein
MIRARAGAAVHAARLEFQMKRAEQREREALARAGQLLAASERVPAPGEPQALVAEARRLRLELEAHSTAVTRSLEADRTDYAAVAGWMRPLVVLRGLSTRAVLRHQAARCERELRPLHERLAAAALAEPGASGAGVPGTLAEAIRSARAERETALAERTRRLQTFDGRALPPWLGWIADEGKALGRSLVKQLQGQLLPRASALAGLVAGWWVARTYTDSRPRSLLRSIGIGHGGTHVVSGDTYRAMSFWLPIAAAAVSAYLGDRIARWVRQRYQAPPTANARAEIK